MFSLSPIHNPSPQVKELNFISSSLTEERVQEIFFHLELFKKTFDSLKMDVKTNRQKISNTSQIEIDRMRKILEQISDEWEFIFSPLEKSDPNLKYLHEDVSSPLIGKKRKTYTRSEDDLREKICDKIREVFDVKNHPLSKDDLKKACIGYLSEKNDEMAFERAHKKMVISSEIIYNPKDKLYLKGMTDTVKQIEKSALKSNKIILKEELCQKIKNLFLEKSSLSRNQIAEACNIRTLQENENFNAILHQLSRKHWIVYNRSDHRWYLSNSNITNK